MSHQPQSSSRNNPRNRSGHGPAQTPDHGGSGGLSGPPDPQDGASSGPEANPWNPGCVMDRRSGLPRSPNEPAAPCDADDAAALDGLDRRRGPGRRLSEYGRAAEEGEFNREQFLFVMAIEEFKRSNHCTFPTWTDVLEVIRLLGYRKTSPSELTLRNAEDWTERPDAPSNVRPKGWEKRAA
jgi:hypothetical protein